MDINDKKKTLDVVWHDVYDLDVYVSPSLKKTLLTATENPESTRQSKERNTAESTPRQPETPSSKKQ